MAKNKLCCRIYPIILILISFAISIGLWYFEEGIHSFSFLTDKDEIFNFLGTVLFVAVIPIGIFYWLNEKERFQSKAKVLSMLGFLPTVILLFILF